MRRDPLSGLRQGDEEESHGVVLMCFATPNLLSSSGSDIGSIMNPVCHAFGSWHLLAQPLPGCLLFGLRMLQWGLGRVRMTRTDCALFLVLALSLHSNRAWASESDAPRVAQDSAAVSEAAERPDKWAQPLTVEGLPNFFKLSDNLYRSAQPLPAGFPKLAGLGIKTVVNLREYHDDAKHLKDTGLAYERIQFTTWKAEDDEVVRFLKIVTDTNRTPVLVHCQHGADRTGTLCALYRIIVQGWSKEEAIREMTGGGYGFHAIWDNLIQYIREVDIVAIKRKLAE